MTACCASHPRRLADDQGAGLVEFALVAPVLILFVIGIVEYGLAYRQDQQIQTALMSAGRMIGQQSNSRWADFEGLRAIDSALGAAPRLTINKVVVYKSTAANGQVPSNCASITPSNNAANGLSGSCNVYSSAQVKTSTPSGFIAGTNNSCASGSWDTNWCPRNRDPENDKVGVYIDVTYAPITRILPNNFTMKRYTVYVVEPSAVGG
ncbi:MAG: TadE/TadG family type IV pilus assembly protein [Acidimicrobiales bacterium]